LVIRQTSMESNVEKEVATLERMTVGEDASLLLFGLAFQLGQDRLAAMMESRREQ
jgi:hypothetical protein